MYDAKINVRLGLGTNMTYNLILIYSLKEQYDWNLFCSADIMLTIYMYDVAEMPTEVSLLTS